MRYRIPVILVAVMALIGLSAPAALAGPNLSHLRPARSLSLALSVDIPVTCTNGRTYGPYHLMTNVDQSLGIHYPGPVNQAIVTSGPGDSYFYCFHGAYFIHNANGNCLRMHDASSGYAVFEQNGCDHSNGGEEWIPSHGTSSGLRLFLNVQRLRYLGVPCFILPGDGVFGYLDAPGNCVNWLPESA